MRIVDIPVFQGIAWSLQEDERNLQSVYAKYAVPWRLGLDGAPGPHQFRACLVTRWGEAEMRVRNSPIVFQGLGLRVGARLRAARFNPLILRWDAYSAAARGFLGWPPISKPELAAGPGAKPDASGAVNPSASRSAGPSRKRTNHRSEWNDGPASESIMQRQRASRLRRRWHLHVGAEPVHRSAHRSAAQPHAFTLPNTSCSGLPSHPAANARASSCPSSREVRRDPADAPRRPARL